ncbi:hypothetical protein QQG55_34485 [Brugia pahangi]
MNWFATTIYYFCVLASIEVEMVRNLPSVIDETEKSRIDENERFHLIGPSEKNWTFHHLDFNDSIIIRLRHTHYEYSKSNKTMSELKLNFLDMKGSRVFYTKLNPGDTWLIMGCTLPYYSGGYHYGTDHYRNYYEFVFIFSVYGILVYHDERYFRYMSLCINETQDIVKFSYYLNGIKDFEAILEVRPKRARIPGDWHLVKPIPIGSKIVIKYCLGDRVGKSIIVIRLADKNGIAALTVTIDYTIGMLFTRRVGLDDKDLECVNFSTSIRYILNMLGRIEIAVFAHQYKVTMLMGGKYKESKEPATRECMIYGHHLSPYDIQQTVFDSANKKNVFYAHYIETV